MPIVFDLDDTLYPELSFVYGGFSAVAFYLSSLMGMAKENIEEELQKELKVKRDQVFDRFLQKQALYRSSLVKKCLSLYRGHNPQISLFPEALECLKSLHGHSLYVVTDGNKIVQRKKYEALGLSQYIKKCFCTHAYGIQRGKPSPYCFEKICLLEKVVPSNVVYIADNPYKDFVGIKPLGFLTVRVLTGPYKECELGEPFEAEWKLNNLAELPQWIEKRGIK